MSIEGVDIRDGVAVWQTYHRSGSRVAAEIRAAAFPRFTPSTIARVPVRMRLRVVNWVHNPDVSNRWFFWVVVVPAGCTWELWARARSGGRVMLVGRRSTQYTGPPDNTPHARRRSWPITPLAGGAGCPLALQRMILYGDVVVWGGNDNGPATVHIVSLPSLRQCFSVRSRTDTWTPGVVERISAWLGRHSCGRAPGLRTEMTYLATGTVRGHRLPIALQYLQWTPIEIGSRYVVWISEKGRLMALDLLRNRMWVLARGVQFAPFFLRYGLVVWQPNDDSIHAFDLESGHPVVVRQGWCAEPAICRLAGIAPGGMVALDVQHFDPSDAHAAREELILEKLR